MEQSITVAKEVSPNIDTEREKLFTDLYYRAFPSIAKFVHNRNGGLEDARDVFHDALVLFYEKKLEGAEYKSDAGYLIGIAKHLWMNKFQQPDAWELTSKHENIAFDVDRDVNETSMLSLLETAGQKCMSLLKEFYYHNMPLEVITKTFGFSSVRSATVQKFKCLEKIREVVKLKSKTYEDFTD